MGVLDFVTSDYLQIFHFLDDDYTVEEVKVFLKKLSVRKKCDIVLETLQKFAFMQKRKWKNEELPRIKYKMKLTKKRLKFSIWDEGFCQKPDALFYNKKLYDAERGIAIFEFDSSYFHEARFACTENKKMKIELIL